MSESAIVAIWAILVCGAFAESAERKDEAPIPYIQPQWHLDYGEAVRLARRSKTMLLVYFRNEADSLLRRQVDATLTADEAVAPTLAKLTLCKVPRNDEVVVRGERVKLIEHGAFAELQGRPGLAIIDYIDEQSPHFGRVVSVYPLSERRRLGRSELLVLLDLPAGTLTQRTMIFAVRTHTEMPASTQGEFISVLAAESESHSQHQANITLQGHHQWESRFHRINARLRDDLTADCRQ